MKKLTSVLLVLTLVMALSVGAFAADYANEAAANAANVAAGTQITVAGVTYTAIDDASQITDLTANYYLTKNITWPGTNLGDFSGSFNGGYHVITLDEDAMFKSVGGPNSVISNFTVTGNEIMGTTTVGAVAYEVNGGVVRNITNYVSILITDKYAGGIFGRVATVSTAESLLIENCVNYAIVNGKERVGGILGTVDGIQMMKTITIKNCVNHGEVFSDSAYYAGGIVACVNQAQVDFTLTFENCVNNGNVSALQSFVGGIFGGAYKAGSTPTLIFKGCTNNGEISTASATNAAFAYGTGGISGGYDQSCIIVTATDCVNNGAISAKNTAAGILGGASQMTDPQYAVMTVTNCVNTGVISAENCFSAIANYQNQRVAAATATFTIKDCYSTVADLKLYEAVEMSGETKILTFEAIDNETVADAATAAAKAQSNTTGITYTVVEGAIRLTNTCVFENGVCKDCGAPDPYTVLENPYDPETDIGDDTTAAATTKKPATTTAPTTTAPAEEESKGGCKGLAVGSVALISMITLAGAAVVSKKND